MILEWFYLLDNDLKIAIKKGFIQILENLSQPEDMSNKKCNISKLHQFFIDKLKIGELKLPKVF
jgi:hypothetical protein